VRKLYLSVVIALGLVGAVAAQQMAKKAEWGMNASIIEACSCPMFCQCYFNTKPAAHTGHGQHAGHGQGEFCRFNNAFKVNTGHHGDTRLDGAKFWVAGDLGGDFTKGMDWAVLHFDPTVTKAQRDAIVTILGRVYPVKWNSFSVGQDLPMEWNAGTERSVAKLDGGKAAEVVLVRPAGSSSGDGPIVIHNLKYFGVPKNDGFIMMPNEVEAYRLGDKAFEFKGTNGFMITFDIDANAPAPAASQQM
jgi:hypothetical protein